MMKLKIKNCGGVLTLITAFFMISSPVSAATSPNLGAADSFSILAGTYSNPAIGTTINGDLGYTTGPVVNPTVNGTTHVADGVYNQAGIDQGTALTMLNSQPCTFNFAPGSIDLATDTTHGTVGIYAPGVYCVTGAASVGSGGITLNGGGTYIFRMTGALTTAANSAVTATGGASACNIWWTPAAATTLGANSAILGTDIDASGITIGSTITWTGRALAFGGTVTTTTDTINTVPACAIASTSPPATTGGGNTSTGLPNTGQAPLAQSSLRRMMPGVISLLVLLSIVALLTQRRFTRSDNHSS